MSLLNELCIYIPAYNAEKTLSWVLDRIPEQFKHEAGLILVVDNCSSDNTSQVAETYKATHQLANLEVIRNSQNLGYGGSQKVGYQRAIERGLKYVAMVHADGQYAPEMLGEMVEPILAGKADLVFGSRIQGNPLKGGMPIHRFLGNRGLTCFQNILLGSHLSEFHSGYRIYSTEALKSLPFMRLANDYHFDTEIIILMIDRGFRITEKKIPTHYGEEENYVNIWRYGMDVVVTTLSYFLHRHGLRRSRNWSRILG